MTALKNKLALAHRILAHLNLDDHTYTHLSSRAPDEDAFYISPFGLCFNEVTASNLTKVGFSGEILEGHEHAYNITGYQIHGAIYRARTDIQHIFHLHTPEIVAVSACEQGLMPVSQWALHFYNKIAYHRYQSLTLEQSQGDALVDDLQNYRILLLRNHGSITCGATIEETLFYTYHLQLAAKTQVMALSMSVPLIMPDKSTCEKSVNDLLSFEKNLGERDWLAWQRKLGSS